MNKHRKNRQEEMSEGAKGGMTRRQHDMNKNNLKYEAQKN